MEETNKYSASCKEKDAKAGDLTQNLTRDGDGEGDSDGDGDSDSGGNDGGVVMQKQVI